MPRLSQSSTLFGQRLREARIRAGIPQDKLGIAIGLDESTSSARISRYETGVHEPPFSIAEKLADVLKVPSAYFYCQDDLLSEIIIKFVQLNRCQKDQLLVLVSELVQNDKPQKE